MALERLELGEAAPGDVGQQLGPVVGCLERGGHHAEVRRVEVRQDDEAIGPVVDAVLDVVGPRPHDPRRGCRVVGGDQRRLRRRAAARRDHEPALAARQRDVEVEPDVVLAGDEDVVGDRRAEPVAPDLVRPHLLVGPGVEQPLPVGRPGDAAPRRRAGQLVGQLGAGGEVPDPQRVHLAAVEVARPRQQRVVRRGLDGVDVEVVVAGGLDVAVEDDVVGRVDRRAAAEDGIALALDGARDVPPRAVLHGDGLVGLLDPRLDLAVELLDLVGVGVEPRRRVGVLGLQVGDRVGVVLLAQPGVGVLDRARRALPRVRLGRRDGRCGEGGEVVHGEAPRYWRRYGGRSP